MAYFREIARGQYFAVTTTGTPETHLLIPRPRNLSACTIIGEGVLSCCIIGQAVFRLERYGGVFRRYRFNYPTLAECYKAAAFNGSTKLREASSLRMRNRLWESSIRWE